MAGFCYFLYISVLCLQYLKTACYTVHVTIKEGDVVEEFTKYYVVNKDVPPFNYFPESSDTGKTQQFSDNSAFRTVLFIEQRIDINVYILFSIYLFRVCFFLFSTLPFLKISN